jgi:type VI secretion system secreted protein VgrG
MGSTSMLNDRLEVTLTSGDTLDIRNFNVAERMSNLFEISLVAVSENADIDFEAAVGQEASFRLKLGALPHQERVWTGLCNHLQQVGVEDHGLSTYQIVIVPTLWLLTQRKNYRMFQQKSELDIALQLLGEWGIQPVQRITGEHKKRKYRVQYAETDFAFLSRLLEDAGISFYFEAEGGETKMVLHDAPQSNALRAPPIAYRDNPTDADMEHVTEVRIARKVRPGKYTLRDHDYRRPPQYKLLASASGASGVEEKLERYHYTPGAFLFESDKGESTPNADDKGKYRTDEAEANALAQKRLDAKRAIAKTVTFDTNTVDLAPGVVMSFLDHPKSDLGAGKRFLVLSSTLSGRHDGKWQATCESVSAEHAYRPAMDTPKPKAIGVESATVVGPAGEEIHTDEFGRVRVHFHWDRESKMDEGSSCWIHVSQPWGGAGFGGSNLPRVGQEVIVDFLGGDPDRPIIVGRVYTNLQKTPYKLPDNKTQSGWQSRSSPGGGGDNFNELMFEDRKGQELVRMQAEKDLNKLVKNDEDVKIGRDRKKQVGRDDEHHVGRNRARSVGNDESVSVGRNQEVSVGKDLAKQVAGNERELTGLTRSVTVGVNRVTQVGAVDALMVGDTHTIAIIPPGEGAGEPTEWKMNRDFIRLATPSGASITLDGDKILLKASGGILIEASGGDVVVKGTPKIKLNP